MKRCYYEVLEIIKPSNENEIRKAYKKLALKWHPDKNPDDVKVAEERFKEVSEAYEVLSDKQKKQLYDTYGHEGLSPNVGRSPAGGFGPGEQPFNFQQFNDPKNMFSDFMKNGFFDDDDDFFGNFFQNRGGQRNPQAQRRNDPFAGFPNFGNSGFASPGFGNPNPGFDSFGGFGNMGGGFGNFGGSFGSPGQQQDPFGDVFSENRFGRAAGGGFPGVSTSTSTSTVIRDGKKVITKKVTKTNPDGTQTTEVTETVSDGQTTQERRFIQDAQTSPNMRINN